MKKILLSFSISLLSTSMVLSFDREEAPSKRANFSTESIKDIIEPFILNTNLIKSSDEDFRRLVADIITEMNYNSTTFHGKTTNQKNDLLQNCSKISTVHEFIINNKSTYQLSEKKIADLSNLNSFCINFINKISGHREMSGRDY